VKRLWNWLTKPRVLGSLLVASLGLFGVMVGFSAALDYTNTTEFCTSCHEMQINYEEYKKSFHHKNISGVHVGCADCHVPKDFPAKYIAKIAASKDVLHHLLGTIDTREKYDARRLIMAERVWGHMEKRKSKNCRSCHDFESMELEEQSRRARRKHQQAKEEGDHCISCHKGIVHTLPAGYDPSDD